MTNPGLPETRWQVLRAIHDYQHIHGWAPSYRELSEIAGIALNTVHYHVARLADAGWIRRKAGVPRALAAVEPFPSRHNDTE